MMLPPTDQRPIDSTPVFTFSVILPECHYHPPIGLGVAIPEHTPVALEYGMIVCQLTEQMEILGIIPVSNFNDIMFEGIRAVKRIFYHRNIGDSVRGTFGTIPLIYKYRHEGYDIEIKVGS